MKKIFICILFTLIGISQVNAQADTTHKKKWAFGSYVSYAGTFESIVGDVGLYARYNRHYISMGQILPSQQLFYKYRLSPTFEYRFYLMKEDRKLRLYIPLKLYTVYSKDEYTGYDSDLLESHRVLKRYEMALTTGLGADWCFAKRFHLNLNAGIGYGMTRYKEKVSYPGKPALNTSGTYYQFTKLKEISPMLNIGFGIDIFRKK